MKRDHSRSQVAAAISRIPSGVAILTASYKGRVTGMLASWIQQASFDPLMVTVCVKKGRPIEALIEGSNKFLLNILGENPSEMFRHFGRGFSVDEDAFENLGVQVNDSGVQLADAIAHIECHVVAKMPAGDHQVYLGEAVAGDADATLRPYVHTRKTALGY